MAPKWNLFGGRRKEVVNPSHSNISEDHGEGDPFEQGIKEVIRRAQLADGKHVDEELKDVHEIIVENVEAEKKVRERVNGRDHMNISFSMLSKEAQRQLIASYGVGEPRFQDGSYATEYDTNILGPSGKPMVLELVGRMAIFFEVSQMGKRE